MKDKSLNNKPPPVPKKGANLFFFEMHDIHAPVIVNNIQSRIWV